MSDHSSLEELRAPSSEIGAFEALLEQCQAVRYDDPVRMVDLAVLATVSADRFDSRKLGAERLADLRCRAWIELGNAYRVADRLDEAEKALGRAAGLYAEGTQDELIGARLYDVQASLDADCRRFPEALSALNGVHAVYLRRGDRHLAGRALLKKGLYAGYGGEPGEAIRLLRESLALIDSRRDPDLVFAAVHNLARSLMDCGQLTEARVLLDQNRDRWRAAGGRMNQIKLRWLEGQIDAGLGELERAERTLDEVRREFVKAGLRYKAALAGLELAALNLRQGQTSQARARVLEAVEVFKALRIRRETLAAALLLRNSFEERLATAALLERVTTFRARAESELARFDPADASVT